MWKSIPKWRRRARRGAFGHIEGAFGAILHGDVAPRETVETPDHNAARDHRPRPDRDGRGQRCRGLRDLRPGRADLWHHAAVDARAPDTGSLCQSGDGAPARRRHRRRPCPPDLRTLRQVLGRIQRRRSFPAQRADDRDRVHRHQPRARLSRSEQSRRRPRRRRSGDACREHGGFPAVRALHLDAGVREPAAAADLLFVHPPMAQVAHDFVVPQIPRPAR